MAMLEAGESTSEVEFKGDAQWMVKSDIKRNEAGLTRTILQKAFEMERPQDGDKTLAKVTDANGDIHIITLTKVSNDDNIKTGEALEPIRKLLARRAQFSGYQDFLASLKEHADVKINVQTGDEAQP